MFAKNLYCPSKKKQLLYVSVLSSSLVTKNQRFHVILLIFANKQDLPGALSMDQIAEALQLSDITTHHWSIQACSAVTGAKLLEGMNWITSDIGARIYTFD